MSLVNETIAQLTAEIDQRKAEIAQREQAITSLRSVLGFGTAKTVKVQVKATTPKTAGKRNRAPQQTDAYRKEASARMKKIWAKRKAAQKKGRS